jgi:hypothetical protein
MSSGLPQSPLESRELLVTGAHVGTIFVKKKSSVLKAIKGILIIE